LDYTKLLEQFRGQVVDYGKEINEQIEIQIKYTGYIERQKREVEKLEQLDHIRIPKHWDYTQTMGIRTEARQKLTRFTPENLGQASRIPGVTPADIYVLMVALKSRNVS
jgi:tRNA uridine 5-carboxymethylaminomethyl modification enzyme